LNLSLNRSHQNVYFIIRDYWGSGVLRGFQVCRGMSELGWRSSVLDIRTDKEWVAELKDTRIVFIKKAMKRIAAILQKLKDNNNILIWDPIDGFSSLYKTVETQYFHAVIAPNNYALEKWRSYFSNGTILKVIHHHWDTRLRPNRAREFRLVYVGDVTPENISEELIKKAKDLEIVEFGTSKDSKEQQNLIEKVLSYNCHLSIRSEDTVDFCFKPNTKLSFASATNSNIILTRDKSNIELLDGSYPYYTESDVDKSLEMIRFAKETYRSSIWRQGLQMMKDVKEKTSLKKIAHHYVDLLTNLS